VRSPSFLVSIHPLHSSFVYPGALVRSAVVACAQDNPDSHGMFLGRKVEEEHITARCSVLMVIQDHKQKMLLYGERVDSFSRLSAFPFV
jgi:hypothetical protein